MTGIDFTVFKGSSSGKIVRATTHKEIGPDDVLVKVTHAGLCGTDAHYRTMDMALGHEGVGVVEQIGSNVTTFKVGERAGWGYQHDACLHCDLCYSGNEIHCPDRELYASHNLDQGAFATHGVWKANFLFHIPDSLDSAAAAPLMCAGGTVFNALLNRVKCTDRVGVVGIGGLGHLAIQYAAKMGCEVIVFSGSENKREEAKKLGATEFYSTKGAQSLSIGLPLQHLIVTTSAQPDWNLFLPLIEPLGTIYPMSVSFEDLKVPYMPFLANSIKFQAVVCPSRGIQNKTLRFAAVHNIKPVMQEFPLNEAGIEEALDRLDKGEVRYRAVLIAQ
ncbi:GroES-like protein [Coniophora puteana RWD-64-598 SS2]|uniref:GroES-like protein n=1 Tax=Coniophora puteana (strain RWD-64-598) TaxID=741705 RepID=A0A5M3MZB5_CONPW|nr:GroES-like protein [Coniophora puteana RWD-64-598 SS2]EIW83961.1 GroES-like protein [Coniophora puteana RWD-64-598 SS2]